MNKEVYVISINGNVDCVGYKTIYEAIEYLVTAKNAKCDLGWTYLDDNDNIYKIYPIHIL